MVFPFPYVERMVYPKTFLRDVHFIFIFDSLITSDEQKTNIHNFFISTFNLEDITIDDLGKNLCVYSKDEMIRFDFSMNHVELAIKQPLYRSYENVSIWRGLMFKFLRNLGIKELKKLIMYKYNELEYQSKDGRKVNSVMSDVFSMQLMADISETDNNLEDLTRWEKTKIFVDEERSNSLFTIEYGFRKKNTEQKSDSLILKTQIESKDIGIALNNIEKMMTSFNQELDNGFHWCVNPDVIEIMKKV